MKKSKQTQAQTLGGPEKGVYSPRFYVRKWPCAVCGKQLLYDSKAEIRKCGCGPRAIVNERIPDSVLRENFEEVK